MDARRDTFQAIADPTRRQIIGMLAEKTMNVNEIASHFDVSRQAISLHIKMLDECRLITIRRSGRERYCEAKLGGLKEVSSWTAQYRKHWEDKLDRLESYLAKMQKSNKYGKRRK